MSCKLFLATVINFCTALQMHKKGDVMRIKRIYKFIFSFLLLSIPSNLWCEIIFYDNFDSHVDWSPDQTVASSCYDGCSGIPEGYFAYYVDGTVFSSDPGHNTLNITAENYRGSGGKALTFWSESNGGGSLWGSDGLLSVKLPDTGYDEIYIRFYIKFQKSWKWAIGMNSQQKLVRASHYIGSNPTAFFETGNHKGLWIGDLAKWNNGTSNVSYVPAYRYENIYFPNNAIPSRNRSDVKYFPPDGSYGGGGIDFGDPEMMGDGNWHCWEFYLKRNSAVGIADGVHRFWQDEKLVYEANNIAFADQGSVSDPRKKWNYVTLGGNNHNLYADVSTRSEQWYAIDDFVISTEYIGPDNCTVHDLHIRP
jgi:hypothetical protein